MDSITGHWKPPTTPNQWKCAGKLLDNPDVCKQDEGNKHHSCSCQSLVTIRQVFLHYFLINMVKVTSLNALVCQQKPLSYERKWQHNWDNSKSEYGPFINHHEQYRWIYFWICPFIWNQNRNSETGLLESISGKNDVYFAILGSGQGNKNVCNAPNMTIIRYLFTKSFDIEYSIKRQP